jgi:glyoxylase-like metal-dependent hydrolase (beta-lactamase superfamily II)
LYHRLGSESRFVFKKKRRPQKNSHKRTKTRFQRLEARNCQQESQYLIEEIAEDFYRIEIPLPDAFLNSVNAYVIRDRERNLIIDTGMHNDECLNVMQTALKKLDVDLRRTDFFITHWHVDHIGLVPRLVRAGCVVYINEIETQLIFKAISGGILSENKALLRLSGFPERDPEKILPPYPGRQVALPFRFVGETDIIERGEYRFMCVSTPGHSAGHTCLYEPSKRMFVAGDHLLKDITPGIQARTDNENPLKEYLYSLDKVHGLDIDLILPGHRAPFRDCKKRIEEIKKHHRQRNLEIISILQEGEKSIYETASQMTWNVDYDSWTSFPSMQSLFATEEAFAHLRYLEENGEVDRTTKREKAIYSIQKAT